MGGKRAGDRNESYLCFHALAVKVSELERKQASRGVGGVLFFCVVFLRCMRPVLVLLLRKSPGREGEAADVAQEGG